MKFLVTETTKNCISYIKDLKMELNPKQQKRIDEISKENSIYFNDLVFLQEVLKEINNKGFTQFEKSFSELIEGAKEIEPELSNREKDMFKTNPEKAIKLKQLQDQYDQRAYNRIVYNVSSQRELEKREDIAQLKDYKTQLNLGLEVIVSMVVMFTVGYWLCSHFFSSVAAGAIGGGIGLVGSLAVQIPLLLFASNRADSSLDKKESQKEEKIVKKEIQERYFKQNTNNENNKKSKKPCKLESKKKR